MPTQTSENILVDLTHITPAFENFFYKVFQIPPTVPIVQATKVQHYVDLFLRQTMSLALDDPTGFIKSLNKSTLLSNVLSTDLDVFIAYKEELKLILLYALNHIVLSINHSPKHVYIIHLVTPTYMVIADYKINEEADTLVYS